VTKNDLIQTCSKTTLSSQKILDENTAKLLCSLTDGDEAWQKKILEDKQITAALLPLFTIYEKEYVYWGLLLNISQHAG
jgi:hypothetical protein